jgi:ArsR family transcriptional regulator, arsenate/arsenite/antimonite-responsive transcriptional repressor
VVDFPINQVLKAMGEPTRIRLLNLLRLGNICVCDLQAVLRISQSNVSLVNCTRKGLRIIYSLAPASTPQMSALRDLLHRCCPLEPLLQQDIVRFRQAVAKGECRLESGSASAAESAVGAPEVEGNPA